MGKNYIKKAFYVIYYGIFCLMSICYCAENNNHTLMNRALAFIQVSITNKDNFFMQKDNQPEHSYNNCWTESLNRKIVLTCHKLQDYHCKDIIAWAVNLSQTYDNVALKNLLTTCRQNDFVGLFTFCLEKLKSENVMEENEHALITHDLISRINTIKTLVSDEDELAGYTKWYDIKKYFIWPTIFLLPFRWYFKKSQENITPPIIQFIQACYYEDKQSKDIEGEWENKTENHVFLKNQLWACYATSNLSNDSSSILASFNDIMIIELTYFFSQEKFSTIQRAIKDSNINFIECLKYIKQHKVDNNQNFWQNDVAKNFSSMIDSVEVIQDTVEIKQKLIDIKIKLQRQNKELFGTFLLTIFISWYGFRYAKAKYI